MGGLFSNPNPGGYQQREALDVASVEQGNRCANSGSQSPACSEPQAGPMFF